MARRRLCWSATRSVRGVISTALRLREEAKLRVRQPLPSVTIVAERRGRAPRSRRSEHDRDRAQREAGRVRRRPLGARRGPPRARLPARRAACCATSSTRRTARSTSSTDDERGRRDRRDPQGPSRCGCRAGPRTSRPRSSRSNATPPTACKTAETPTGIVVALDTRLDDELDPRRLGARRDPPRAGAAQGRRPATSATASGSARDRRRRARRGGAATHVDTIAAEVLADRRRSSPALDRRRRPAANAKSTSPCAGR